MCYGNMLLCFFFFFKQKTAYEMRISDWSSDVCSSDLGTLQPHGFPVVDAPVSGGVKRALDGTLAIMVGGESEAARRIMPLLAAPGGAIFRTGPLGSGHAMKTLNNYVPAAGPAAAAEADPTRVGSGHGVSVTLDLVCLRILTKKTNNKTA